MTEQELADQADAALMESIDAVEREIIRATVALVNEHWRRPLGVAWTPQECIRQGAKLIKTYRSRERINLFSLRIPPNRGVFD